MYGTCAENIYLDLGKEDKEHEFDLLWTRLEYDDRIFMREGNIKCSTIDAVEIQNDYNIKLYDLEDYIWD